MEETTIAVATADVVTYDEIRKQWHSPDGCAEPARSHVRILHNTQTNNFRIVGTRINDGEWVLNFKIFERLKYKPSTLMFHQWRDEKRQVFGLNFVSEEEARLFIKVMTHALNILSSASDYQYSADLGLSNGVYQEPQQLHHNAHSTPSFRDNDEESVCSSTMPPNHSNSFRKGSQPIQCSTNGGGTLVGVTLSNVQQRRASQGSSSSSNGSGGVAGFHVSGAITNATSVSNPSRNTGLPLVCGGNSNEVTVNSTGGMNAPPPPPPPPPPLSLLMSEKKNASSMAEQIKNVQLRKVSSVSSNISNGIGRGRDDLFSELEERLNKRKNQAEGESTVVNSNLGMRRPWDKQLFSSQNGGSLVNDSPKTHRKVPSVSSLSSQDEPRMITAGVGNGIASVGAVSCAQTVSNSAINSACDGNFSQVDVIEKLKREILGEVLKEINNAKMEIIEVIRSEIRRM